MNGTVLTNCKNLYEVTLENAFKHENNSPGIPGARNCAVKRKGKWMGGLSVLKTSRSNLFQREFSRFNLACHVCECQRNGFMHSFCMSPV